MFTYGLFDLRDPRAAGCVVVPGPKKPEEKQTPPEP
jgi:hypothetical protein